MIWLHLVTISRCADW